jgi:PTH1 family peptidyl-tRNA hydrolase
MGIGRPAPGSDAIKHVLMNFRPDEQSLINEAVSKIPNVIDCIIDQGFTIAMNRFNG